MGRLMVMWSAGLILFILTSASAKQKIKIKSVVQTRRVANVFKNMQPFQKSGLSSNKAAKTRRNYLVKCCGMRSCYSVDNNSQNSTKIKRNHSTQVGMKNTPSGAAKGGAAAVLESGGNAAAANTNSGGAPGSGSNAGEPGAANSGANSASGDAAAAGGAAGDSAAGAAAESPPSSGGAIPPPADSASATGDDPGAPSGTEAAPATSASGNASSASNAAASNASDPSSKPADANGTTSTNATATGASATSLTDADSTAATNGSAVTTAASNVTSAENSTAATSTTILTTTRIPHVCPQDTLSKNASYFGADGKIKSQFGFELDVCKTTIFLGIQPMTWNQNFNFCSSLGMKPFFLNSSDDISCFKNFLIDNWEYNFNYWSGGILEEPSMKAMWCPQNQTAPESDLTWESKAPAAVPSCMRMKVYDRGEYTKRDFKWNYKNCSWKFMPACRGPPSLNPPPKCTLCKRNTTLFMGQGYSLINFTQYGKWKRDKSNFTYLIGANKTWSDALCHCGTLGMKLLDMNSTFLNTKLRRLTKLNGFLSKTYWSSGYGASAASFSWCTANTSIDAALWKNGEPGTGTGCVSATYPKIPKNATDDSAYAAFLEVTSCDKNQSYICISNHDPRSPRKKEDDCMEAFGITQDEVDKLFTMAAYTPNLKCFLRCMGESFGAMKSSLPYDPAMIALIELTAASDESMQKSLDIYSDNCSKKRGADACETAAQVFRCEVENDPTVANDMTVKRAETSAVDSSLNTPPAGYFEDAMCFPAEVCVTEANAKSRKDNYQSELSSTDFFLMACGKLYFIVKLAYGHQLMWTECCKLDMKMAVLDTPEEFECVVNALAAMTTPNKLWSATIRLYASNQNFAHTYIWCDNDTLVDPAIPGALGLNFEAGGSVSLFFDAAAPAISKLISSGFGDGSSGLCED